MRTATRTVIIVALCAVALSLVGASPAGADVGDDCLPGTYGPGQPDCSPAPPGTYVDQAGQPAATPCPIGTYQPAWGATSCNFADPGTFVATMGQVVATPCLVGTYQPASAATSCFLAPLGSYVNTVGAVAATPCPPGKTTLFLGAVSADDCVSVAAVPPSASACKKGGWTAYTDYTGHPFRNQGDCVSWVATGGRNPAAG